MNSERKERHPSNREPHIYQNKNRHNVKKKEEKCCGGHPIIESEGEIVIGFQRASFNLTVGLPFAFWGTLYIGLNNFGAVLAPYLPAGITVTSHIDQTNGNLIFRYTDGTNVDTIIMNMPESLISYSETLESINTSYMRTNYAIMSVNSSPTAPTLSNQNIYLLQSNAFIFTKVSALSNTGGSKTKDIIIPRSRMNPNTSQLNIIELYLRKQEVKPDTVWITTFPYINTGSEPVPIDNYLTVIINEFFDVNNDADKIEN